MITVRLDSKKVVAEMAGRPVGALSFFHNRFHYHPRIYSVAFSDFAASADTALVAGGLYDRLVQELRPQKPLLLRTGVDEGDAFYTVLRALGFRDYRHVYFPTLDVTAFDFDLLRDAESMFAASGYTLVRLADLELTTEVEAGLYDLHTEVYTDTSTVVPATPEHFSRREWLEGTLLSDEAITEACFIAVKKGEFVWFGGLFHGDVAGELETGTFGTTRSYRTITARSCWLSRLERSPTLERTATAPSAPRSTRRTPEYSKSAPSCRLYRAATTSAWSGR